MKLVKLRTTTGQVIAVQPSEVLVAGPTNDLTTTMLIIRGVQQPIPVMGTSSDVTDFLNGDVNSAPRQEEPALFTGP